VPLLARMLPAPLHVEISAGALDEVPRLVVDGRISSDGRFALVVGSGIGREVVERVGAGLPREDVFVVDNDRIDTAMALSDGIRDRRVDIVVAVGGGRTLDVAKLASSRLGLPMVSVATSLAHDGVASPVAVLSVDGGRASFGVATPVAVVVDLELVGRSPVRMLRAGIGDVVSNASALADWRLARDVRGEAIDGLAASFAGTAAQAVLEQRDPTRSPRFLACLADALVLSGIAMAVAGSSRPCSGACHEISHALDELHPGLALHGEQVALGALFASVLRGDWATASALAECMQRHGLPRTPAEIGLDDSSFVAAVRHAPSTRPERYTVLEHLAPTEGEIRDALALTATLGSDRPKAVSV
jgi:glycerol-1-phosphate dehydrogenase [NAD(P)+]